MPFRAPVLRACLAAFALGLLSAPVSAAVPRIVGRPMVRNAMFNGVANTMMYTVTAKVDGTGADADHVAMVGFVPSDDYTTCSDAAVPWKWSHEEVYDTTDTQTWTLYNFVPGVSYHYKWMVGDPSGTTRFQCGVLTTTAAPTPTLPSTLAALNIQYDVDTSTTFETDYALLESSGCASAGGSPGYYLIVVDPVNEAIVWYLDVAAASGSTHSVGSGLHYQPGATPAEDLIHLIVGKTEAVEFAFDGTVVHSFEFGGPAKCGSSAGAMGPCIHHTVMRSDLTGNTYAMAASLSDTNALGTDWDPNCDEGSQFIDEGYLVLDADWNVIDENYMMADGGYDPTVDGGPDAFNLGKAPTACNDRHWAGSFDASIGMIDWIHLNALALSSYGSSEVVDVSSKQWDQVTRFDATSGTLLWNLSPHSGYTDWGTLRIASGVMGEADFGAQHDVHAIGPDTLMMVDNRGDATGSRILEIDLARRPLSATITKSWMIVDAAGDPLRCAIEGTAQPVPGSTDDRVLSACNTAYSIVELSDPTGGAGSAPPLYISLPDGTTEDYCTTGGPSSRMQISGWHKAYPLASVGEF